MSIRTPIQVPEELKTKVDNLKDGLYCNALDAAGYHHCPATEAALIECFKDYAAAGYWADLDLDDVEELTVSEMCHGLIKG